jgi:hypothetical protein
VYLWKGFGRGAHSAGPGGAQLRFVCQESFKRWTIEFEGAAQRVPRQLVAPGARGALPDGPIIPLRLNMTAVADGPVWDLTAALSAHGMGNAHYNQSMCITQGEIVIDDAVVTQLSGVAWRDHTRGPRELSELGSYACIQGGFPGGRRFIVLALNHRDESKQPLRSATVSEGDDLRAARIVETTAIPENNGLAPPRYIVRLETDNGIETIEGERTTTGVVVGVGAPNHFMLGPATDCTARGHLCGTPTRFRWNGETCYGYSELTAAVGGSLGVERT